MECDERRDEPARTAKNERERSRTSVDMTMKESARKPLQAPKGRRVNLQGVVEMAKDLRQLFEERRSSQCGPSMHGSGMRKH